VITSLNNDKAFIVRIFLISSIPNDYKYFFTKDIQRYVNDLSYQIIDGKKEDERNSLIMLFSINDRQMRLRTGYYVRSYVPDDKAQSLLDSTGYYLRRSEYSTAVNYLMQKVYDRITSPYTFVWDILEWGLIGLFIIGCVIAFFCMGKKRVSSGAATRLNRIQNIVKQNKPRREIVDTTCVICLEELGASDTKLKPKVDNSLQDELQHDSTSVAKIECGHSFHYGCITQWTRDHNTCPTCREKIDKEGNGRELSENLVAVQMTMFPDISRVMIVHGINFSWRNNYFTGSSGGSGFSWNFGSGGASSNW
jgi:uncharacterized membrane protein YgcG